MNSNDVIAWAVLNDRRNLTPIIDRDEGVARRLASMDGDRVVPLIVAPPEGPKVLGWAGLATTLSAQALWSLWLTPWSIPVLLAGNLLWIWYARLRKDNPVLFTNLGFVALNLSGMLKWIFA